MVRAPREHERASNDPAPVRGARATLLALVGTLGSVLNGVHAMNDPNPPRDPTGAHDAGSSYSAAEGADQRWYERAARAAKEWANKSSGYASRQWESVRDRASSYTDQARRYTAAAPAYPRGVRLLADAEPTESRTVAADGTARAVFLDSRLGWTDLARSHEALPERLVVLVHGLDEPGSIWDDLAPALRDRGLRVARFDYANDAPIADSASALLESLRDLHCRGVRRVDLVGHSMGGLLSREVLTNPDMYGGRGAADPASGRPSVERLVMLGTPNHGSALARLRGVAEAREHLERWISSFAYDRTPGVRRGDPRLLLGFLYDHVGGAGADLLPDSPFLRGLNARPVPADVSMTIVAARVADPGTADAVRLLDSPTLRRVLGGAEGERLDWAAEKLRGAINGLGDGVVSLESARLEGVDDFVIVGTNHRWMIKRTPVENSLRALVGYEASEAPPALDIVVDRLTRPVPSARE
ncbi:MAG: hypothetical protein JNM07_04335 [Phycisphaerae bacterium]|nr:hypothetical protein [Phycisphaerae bacterium]